MSGRPPSSNVAFAPPSRLAAPPASTAPRGRGRCGPVTPRVWHAQRTQTSRATASSVVCGTFVKGGVGSRWMASLLSVADARAAVLAEVASPLPGEPVPLAAALGRVLAQSAVAAETVPGRDNSAMDGYAVRAADTKGASEGSPARLRLAGESRAGAPAGASLKAGEAFGISTGAVVPDGADAVVRVE